MAQITIYIDNNLEEKIKEVAKSTGQSISKYISNAIEQKLNNSWNEDIKNLSGSWSDFPTLEEIRNNTIDIKREEF
jgi:metal-responsive CopG/Arc/MetJ family transcriptional regulator